VRFFEQKNKQLNNMKNSYKRIVGLSFLLLGLMSFSSYAQVSKTKLYKVNSGNSDAEETAPGGSGTVGAMDLTSSDLELMTDGSKKQLIGLRFANIDIPQGATVLSAYVQFATKGDKNAVSGIIRISAQDIDDAPVFLSTSGNISARTKLANDVSWAGSTSSSWGTASGGAAGADQRTPDIASVIQPIISRGGWVSGNALALILSGEGTRNAFSFDGDNNLAPTLIIKYNVGATTTIAATNFPIAKNSEWKYLDDGTDKNAVFADPAFDDSQWSSGFGKLGYADNATTVLGFGPNSGSKYITYYFRKKFNVANTSLLSNNLNIKLLRDDAAIVYINGTEVLRDNLPASGVTYLTNSTTIVDGADESAYFTYTIPTSILINGENTIAVEVHQRDGSSSDLGFDLELLEAPFVVPVVPCDPMATSHISNFVSVLPSAQPDYLRIPSTHAFQMLIQSGTPYTNPTDGNMKGTFDFTGYVPITGSSTNGHLSINHEEGSFPSAGVSILDINFNGTNKLWQIANNVPVDFAPIAGTGRNCSGGITPWGTIVTTEEILPTTDANSDGYQDIGWLVEIDPVTRKVKDYDNDGTPDKIWKAGRMSHENAAIAADRKTVYEGNDENPGYVWKYVATTAENLSDGKLYVLKLTGTLTNSTGGEWIEVPNSTPAECNNVRSFAASVSATNFDSVEDVEIGTVDGMIYFTSKASSRVYRFTDNGLTVANFSIFVGNSSTQYTITHDGGTVNESWGSGNDNLTFDDEGNLYVIQDGSRNHIWMVKPCHTQASPQVELFAVTPAGSEPTGMTFSPDYKFMFVSIQHPSSGNTTQMTDAAGNQVRFNKESAIVIARKEYLGVPLILKISLSSFEVNKITENKVKVDFKFETDQTSVNFEIERMLENGAFESIKQVNNLKSTVGINEYTFYDENVKFGTHYYRIKSIDNDGKISYSTVKSVKINSLSDKTFEIYPNPVKNILKINFESAKEEAAVLKVYNNLGVVVASKSIQILAGKNETNIDVTTLASGVYHLSVIIDGKKISKSFIKN
jgi:secreted PhoX family phosphatase